MKTYEYYCECKSFVQLQKYNFILIKLKYNFVSLGYVI